MKTKIFKNYLIKQIPLLFLFVLIIIFSFLTPVFYSINNIMNIFNQMTINGFMVIGITFVIISGGFDLSIGMVMSVCALLTVSLQNFLDLSIPISILISILAGISIGFVNGVLITKAKINPFITTLGTYITLNGVVLLYSKFGLMGLKNSNYKYTYITEGKLFHIPFSIWFFILVIFLSYIILSRTLFGRRIYAIGGSEDVCKMSGINVDLYKIILYMISGLFASIAGIILVSRAGSASPMFGQSTMLIVIGAVVIGGTSLEGGTGGIFSSLVGLALFAVLQNAFGLLNVFTYYQQVLWGVLLAVIMVIDSYAAKKRRIESILLKKIGG